MSSIIFIVAIFALMYFMMIRPQRKRANARAAMLRAADVGDVIATVGGVIGTIVAIEEVDGQPSVVCIEVDSDVELRIQHRAIAEIIERAADADGPDLAGPSDNSDYEDPPALSESEEPRDAD